MVTRNVAKQRSYGTEPGPFLCLGRHIVVAALGSGMHWKGGCLHKGRPAYAQPLSPGRQVPPPTAFVTDSNRPPTACLTASGAASEAPSLLMHPWTTGLGLQYRARRGRLPLRRGGSAPWPCPEADVAVASTGQARGPNELRLPRL